VNPRALIAATLSFALARPAAARDVRVRPHDGPSLDDAIRAASPGDNVLLAPGVYPGGLWIERSGSPGRPITIRAERPGTVVIEGGGEGIDIGGGAHDLVLQDLEVRNTGDNLVHVQDGAHDVTLRGLRVHDAGDDGDGIKVNQARDIRIERVECFHPGRRPDRPGGNPSQECIDLVDVTRAVISDCYLHDGGNTLLFAKGGSHDIVFERNALVGQGRDAIDPCVGVGSPTDPELLRGQSYEAFDVVVRNNLVVGCHAGAVGVYDALHAWVVNNTFVDDGDDVVQFRAGNGPRAESRDVHFANNVFADASGRMVRAFALRSHALALFDARGDLYWNGRGRIGAEGLVDPRREPGAVIADPGLIALGAHTRWPVLASMAVVPTRAVRDAGARLDGPGRVDDDYLGRARPAGAGVDIGAFEIDATQRRDVAVGPWPSEQSTPSPTEYLIRAAAPARFDDLAPHFARVSWIAFLGIGASVVTLALATASMRRRAVSR
jgi:hypothetical protein